jgi:starch phosphorylase
VFNQGEYVKAVEEKNWAETITKVLYPSDATHAGGRELRLIQEYFLVTCLARHDPPLSQEAPHLGPAPAINAIQLNDTHPALGGGRADALLRGRDDLPWDQAWDITTRTFAYTNHTLLPEALERWPVPLMEKVLPRHLQIIYEINARFLQQVPDRSSDEGQIRRMSLIDEGEGGRYSHGQPGHRGQPLGQRRVRAAHRPAARVRLPRLRRAVAGQDQQQDQRHHAPPLAAGVQSAALRPGHPPHRRWLGAQAGGAEEAGAASPPSPTSSRPSWPSSAPTRSGWPRRMRELTGEWIDPASLFDVQIKRLHEYKRQLLNAMHIITLYHRIKANV